MKTSRLGMIISSLVWILVVATQCVAQEKASAKISGRLVDDSTNAPIANANVFIANSMPKTRSALILAVRSWTSWRCGSRAIGEKKGWQDNSPSSSGHDRASRMADLVMSIEKAQYMNYCHLIV